MFQEEGYIRETITYKRLFHYYLTYKSLFYYLNRIAYPTKSEKLRNNNDYYDYCNFILVSLYLP